MPEITSMVDVLIANEEDCQKCLGLEVDVDVESGEVRAESYRGMTDSLFKAYENLRYTAVSLRESLSADYNRWSGLLAARDGFYVSRKYEIRDIVDRIGGGDSFGSGLIYGLRNLDGPQQSIEFAMAASALKHTIYGDYNRVTKEDVLALAGGSGSGRVQR
jgi:2-dehydro-3-deoxygluconokinase